MRSAAPIGAARGIEGLGNLLIETPNGRIPLAKVASIEDSDGPNQISRDNGRRRIVISANSSSGDLSALVERIRQEVAAKPLPTGYFTSLEGQFQAQEEASRLMGMLALISLALIFMVLYRRYQSATLAAVIMTKLAEMAKAA